MALIDMLTDIKSFNYNKVGKKHDEYFGEDNATGFTTNRDTKNPTEFGGVNGEKFNSNSSVYSKIKGVDFFTNTNRPGFLFDMTTDFDESKTSLYIIGSGNDFNFTEKRGFSTFNVSTPYTIDRDTGDETELPDGGGSLYSKKINDFRAGLSRVDFFGNEHRPGFLPNLQNLLKVTFFTGLTSTEFDTNSSLYSTGLDGQQLTGVDFIFNTNATGFTPNRKTQDLGPGLGERGFTELATGEKAGEYLIGGTEYGFPTPGKNFGGEIFFSDIHATGFTPNRTTKDLGPGLGQRGFSIVGNGEKAGEYKIGSSDYDKIVRSYENFPVLSTAVFENSDIPLRDSLSMQSDGTFSLKQYSVLNTSYGQIRVARSVDNRNMGINLGNEVPKESKDYITSKPNIPTVPDFSEGHVYGAPISRLALEDRKGDVDNQYIKFGGGNAGLRPGYASNANQGVFGFDSPYIIKEIGDRYDSLDWAVDSAITILPFKIVRTAEDVIRIGKWNLTAKGIMWNANQFLLTNQGARQETKLFNPLGTLGSIVPHVHLPRHTDGTFKDFEEPDKYPDKITGTSTIFAHKLHQPLFGESGQRIPDDPTGLAQEALDRTDASFKGMGINYTNRMENLRYYRVEENKGPVPNLHPLTALGLGNKEFVDPTHHVKSTKGPFGENLGNKTEDGEKIEDKHSSLITNYKNLENFPASTGQGGVRGIDSSLKNMEQMNLAGDDVEKINIKQSTGAVLASEVSKKKGPVKKKELATKYNLGRGLISKGDKLYEVGTSNMLQVPYGGVFNKLKSSIGDLPKDFINFRIRDAVNGKWLIFPAHLGAITDTISPEWTKEAYIGRPDEVHIYTKTSRTVGFDFKVAAFTKQEIPIIQEKMNYLVGLGYPTFKKMLPTDVEERPVSPYIYLTIGDLFNNTPGYFDSITISTEENYTWEIDEGFQTPMMYNVSVNFVYIGRHLPQTLGKHYDVPWLKDSGAGPNKYGTFGSQDPRDESPKSIRPFIEGGDVEDHWSKNVQPHGTS